VKYEKLAKAGYKCYKQGRLLGLQPKVHFSQVNILMGVGKCSGSH